VLAGDAAGADRRADRALVLVALCGIDVPVAGLERGGDHTRSLLAVRDLPHPKAESGKPYAVCDLDRAIVVVRRCAGQLRHPVLPVRRERLRGTYLIGDHILSAMARSPATH
jgi:hypothetical protein